MNYTCFYVIIQPYIQTNLTNVVLLKKVLFFFLNFILFFVQYGSIKLKSINHNH